MILAVRSYSSGRGAQAALLAGVFAVGVAAGAMIGPVGLGRTQEPAPPPAPARPAARADMMARGSHPAEVLRVLDGDTFEARVHLWPGLDVTTKVRLRGIDAPEMKARCREELTQAEAARDALVRILAEGEVAIGRVTFDKYGGRVDADAATRATPSVSQALLDSGLARAYDGGRRQSWCNRVSAD